MSIEIDFPRILPAEPELFCFHTRDTAPNLVDGRILMVGVSGRDRGNVEACLNGLDREVLEARNTSEAIALMSRNKIDLVLVDSMVPEMGGVEFCRMVKKADATQFVPVFVMAGPGDVENEIPAIQAGADEFLVKPLRLGALRARVEASLRRKARIELLDDSETVLFSLAQSVEDREPGLGRHCERIALLSAALGASLGLPVEDLVALQRGGYLHDIGKVAVPDHVLFKAGPLNPEEWTIMQAHTERGERICSSMRSLSPVLPIIRHHHEKWNGTGYPDGLKGEQIPMLARILQIADIYDALTTARPYKRAFSAEEALRIMNEEASKGWRDPKLVERFSKILPTLRTPAVPDVSTLSLQALAGSLHRHGMALANRL